MKNMYIITGAAGFLGGTICRQLVERGEYVRATDLPSARALSLLEKDCEVIPANLVDIPSLEKVFDTPAGVDVYVIHCASIVTVDPDYNQRVMDVNVGGTKNIIEMCLSHPAVKKLVYVSSTGAIPEEKGNKEIEEVSSFNPDRVVGCYSQSKALASQAVLDAVHKRGLNASIVHPSGIMGPEDYGIGETTGTMIKIIKGAMPMGIDGSFNLCDVRDLAAGCIAAVDKGRKGECYILGNKEVKFKDFAKLISEESGCRPIKHFLSCGMAEFLARIMEKKAGKHGKKPLMTTFSVYNLARNNKYDSSKAERELGYHTRSYQETIHDEITWLKKTGKIA